MKRARRVVLALVVGLGMICAAGAGGAQTTAHSQSVVIGEIDQSYFDWDALGMVTPVRRQLGCASSWAFTSAAMLESAAARDTGRKVDLSEQYLLNCAGPGYSCQGGGWGALDFFQNTYLPPQREAGAVLESVLPYRGKAAACSRVYAHPYRIDRWGYVNPQGASVEEIKRALLDYGPLGTALCAGLEFQNYRAGVYRVDESSFCRLAGLQVNQSVLITGWDDLNGCWKIKNSWGTGWGQGGFGCVQYGLPGTAENAVYLLYRAAPGAPLLASPSGGALVKTFRPQLAWKAASGHVDGYQLQIALDAAFTLPVLDTRVTGLAYLPETDLPANALLYWRVRAWRGPESEILSGQWSAARTLKTLPAVPIPISPLNEVASSLRPTFTWEEPDALRYDWQVSRQLDCGRVLRSAQVVVPAPDATRPRLLDLAYTPANPLPAGAALYWRARARGLYGLSAWSACVPFWTP